MYQQEPLSKASKYCLDNAKQYVKYARILYSTKSYGHALALTVLSDVELGKSVIYHICSKGMITEEVLPTQFISYLKEKEFNKLASETWWLGLVLASNLEVLVPSLFTLCEYSGKITVNQHTSELSQETHKQMFELIEKMKPENKKIIELLEFACKGFFVNLNFGGKKVDCPLTIKKSLVKKRLEKAKERIENGEPFLLLSFSEIQIKIAQRLLKAAFESIIPIRTEINQLILPLKTC